MSVGRPDPTNVANEYSLPECRTVQPKFFWLGKSTSWEEVECGRVGGKPGVGRNCSRSLSWCSANEKSEGKVSYLKKANRGKGEESRGRRTKFVSVTNI